MPVRVGVGVAPMTMLAPPQAVRPVASGIANRTAITTRETMRAMRARLRERGHLVNELQPDAGADRGRRTRRRRRT